MGNHMPPARVVRRVLAKVIVQQNGCVVSTYSTANHGYAQVGWVQGGKTVMTLCHLVVWRAHHGPIEDGFTVDHECSNRRCVRLEHLRLLPNLENARRTNGRDWPLGQCAHGHDDAVHWRPKSNANVKGYCNACRTVAQRARRRAARARAST